MRARRIIPDAIHKDIVRDREGRGCHWRGTRRTADETEQDEEESIKHVIHPSRGVFLRPPFRPAGLRGEAGDVAAPLRGERLFAGTAPHAAHEGKQFPKIPLYFLRHFCILPEVSGRKQPSLSPSVKYPLTRPRPICMLIGKQ